jgi:hypothetical protein
MQILHGPWDPKRNVYTGARMLAQLYQTFGDWSLALAGYNAGPGAVVAAGGIPPFRETRDYVIIVEYLWDTYDHRHLSLARLLQYRDSLRDLTSFEDQRTKVGRLARIAHITDITLDRCALGSCIGSQSTNLTKLLDPFWPIAGAPDPLQQVGPDAPVPGIAAAGR